MDHCASWRRASARPRPHRDQLVRRARHPLSPHAAPVHAAPELQTRRECRTTSRWWRTGRCGGEAVAGRTGFAAESARPMGSRALPARGASLVVPQVPVDAALPALMGGRCGRRVEGRRRGDFVGLSVQAAPETPRAPPRLRLSERREASVHGRGAQRPVDGWETLGRAHASSRGERELLPCAPALHSPAVGRTRSAFGRYHQPRTGSSARSSSAHSGASPTM
ncbi:MAG: hypothetical protein JWM10_3694 [Myxococcaceae bacterium]|nr:hypothetical protein [Myxococcaceae bacterium]